MAEVNVSQGNDRLNVVCTWCGEVIRPAVTKPKKGMCQSCFARMMREHSHTHQARAGWRDASDR